MANNVSRAVLCCRECETPLQNGYCGKCGLHPSMQDTYIKRFCVKCQNEIQAITPHKCRECGQDCKGFQCPGCGLIYAK